MPLTFIPLSLSHLKVTPIRTPMKSSKFIALLYSLRTLSDKRTSIILYFISFFSFTTCASYPAYHSQCISIAAVRKEEGAPIAVFRNRRASQSNDQVDYSGVNHMGFESPILLLNKW